MLDESAGRRAAYHRAKEYYFNYIALAIGFGLREQGPDNYRESAQRKAMTVGGKAKQTFRFQNMTYGFFADKVDKLQILEYIFSETDLRVYDLGSSYGEEICNYESVEEISEKFDLVNGDKSAVTFQLWTPRHKGKPIFRKIDLDPKRCNGHTFRYSTDGWGSFSYILVDLRTMNLINRILDISMKLELSRMKVRPYLPAK